MAQLFPWSALVFLLLSLMSLSCRALPESSKLVPSVKDSVCCPAREMFIGGTIQHFVDSMGLQGRMIKFLPKDDGALTECVFLLEEGCYVSIFLPNWADLNYVVSGDDTKAESYQKIKDEVVIDMKCVRR